MEIGNANTRPIILPECRKGQRSTILSVEESYRTDEKSFLSLKIFILEKIMRLQINFKDIKIFIE